MAKLSRARVQGGLEISVILLWALYFTWPYLDFDPLVVPTGGEYLALIQPYHVWTRLLQCGACAMWNGSVRGGVPAFAELHAGVLHPLSAIATLVSGVPTGMKLTLVGAFMMAGLGQWWLGRLLHVGSLARVWSGCMAVAAGCLASRMEGGWVNMVLSTAAAALVLPALVGFARSGSRRWAAILGITLALLAMAGQGYLQAGMLFLLPLGLILVDAGRMGLVLRRFALALVVALLVAAPLLVPMLHFMPEFGKDTDADFRTTQSFRFVPLNLVIDDLAFFAGDTLEKGASAALHVNFVGWVPVLLALAALLAVAHRERWPGERRHSVFLVAVMVMAFWVASSMPLRWLIRLSPIDWLDWQFAGIRNPSPIAGLAAAPLLALAAMAVDRYWAASWAPALVSLRLGARRARDLRLEPRWLILPLLVVALVRATAFDRQWLETSRLGPEIYALLEALRTPSLEWVNPPYGENMFIEPAVGMGLKLAMDNRVWHWTGHPDPEPLLAEGRSGPPWPEMKAVKQVGGGDITLYQGGPELRYATVTHGADVTPCTAHGVGGDIDLSCAAPAAGKLTVRENHWTGWRAYVDGDRVPLNVGTWISLDLPAGSHDIRLRYRPWDVPLGLLLGLIGWVLAGFLIWRGDLPDARKVPDRRATGDADGLPDELPDERALPPVVDSPAGD